MRNVRYRVDDRVTLWIRYLRGALVGTTPKVPPWFEDPSSFVIAIDTGDVGITPASLSALLNGYVFNYEGSPLKQLQVTIDKGQLIQRGTLHKVVDLPFTVRTTFSVTSDGRLRLHPTSVKVIGLPVKGLMRLFSIELDNLVHVRQGRGVELAGNDFLLAPANLLPPPRIRGRLTAVHLDAGEIRQTFGASERRRPLPALRGSDPTAPNYMFYRGGVLRFGKLTMVDADLQIVDADPKDPYYGLVAIMPDYSDLRGPAQAGAKRK